MVFVFCSVFWSYLIAPLLQDYFWGKKKRPGLLHEVVIATIAAQIATLPIIIYVFGYYSAYAVLSNLLVVPLIPFTMLLTFIAGIVGLIAPVFAPIFGAPVVWLLNYMMFVVEQIAAIPGVKTEVSFSPLAVAISYLIIIALTVWLWRVTRHNFRRDTLTQREF